MNIILKRSIIIFVLLTISLICIYTYILTNTIDLDKESIAKDIEKRASADVEILQVTENKNDQFILFKNKSSGQLGMIYYKPHTLLASRYVFLGGTNITGRADINHKYDVYDFGQTTDKGFDRLFVVYGYNEPKAQTVKLEFDNNTITSNIGGNDYFLQVFSFSQDKFSSPKVKFLDKAGEDITQKFL
ncbi:MAG: hypothetical protein GX434_16025 [Peptococcaceae bacterium]|nr:hypothetical protein [Peptococcaceae bacterium]